MIKYVTFYFLNSLKLGIRIGVKMLKKFFHSFLILNFSFILVIAQDDNYYNDSYCSDSSLDIGVENSGISFGNSKKWNGLRFNIIDCGRIQFARDSQNV